MKLYTRLFLMFVVCVLTGLLPGCALPGASSGNPTIDPNMIITAAAATAYVRLSQTAVVSAFTATPSPSETPQPTATEVVIPTSVPTLVPMSGKVRANANVRNVPGKNNASDIGGLLLGERVSVIGRNDAATWLYIIYPSAPDGKGWVISNAITLDGEMGLLAVLIFPGGMDAEPVILPPFIYRITGTTLPPSTPAPENTKFGTLLQPANVRAGPSVGFLTIGILKPGTKVVFTGRIQENTWVQIDYPSGPGGRGWLLSALVQANDGYGGQPYFNVLGTPDGADAGGQPKPTEALPAAVPTKALPGVATNTPESPANSQDVIGVVTNQINVRAGPAQLFQSFGLLNPQEKVTVVGRTISGLWLRVKFAQSPDGFGWVASQYVKVQTVNIPYYNNEGTPVPK